MYIEIEVAIGIKIKDGVEAVVGIKIRFEICINITIAVWNGTEIESEKVIGI